VCSYDGNSLAQKACLIGNWPAAWSGQISIMKAVEACTSSSWLDTDPQHPTH
jgi:hypothetical protein